MQQIANVQQEPANPASSIVNYGAMAVHFDITDVEGKLTEIVVISHGGGDEVRRIAQPADRTKYAKAYEHFAAGDGPVLVGTPIADVPGLTRRQVASLQALGFASAEQFRDANESTLSGLGMDGKAMHDRVKMWLDASEDNAEQARIAEEKAEAERRAQAAEKEMEEMRQKLADMESRMAAVIDEGDSKPKRGRGRPKKEPEVEMVDDGLPDIDSLPPDAMAGGDEVDALVGA